MLRVIFEVFIDVLFRTKFRIIFQLSAKGFTLILYSKRFPTLSPLDRKDTTYIIVDDSENIAKRHYQESKESKKWNAKITETQKQLLYLYWTPKMHKIRQDRDLSQDLPVVQLLQ